MKLRIQTFCVTIAFAFVAGSNAWASEEAAGHAEEGGLLTSLGIDPKLILLQLFAFVLLLLLLRKFLWGPMLSLFDQRQQDVDTMIREAEDKHQAALQEFEEYGKRLAASDEEARRMIQAALEQAAQQKNEILEDARQKADQIIANGVEQVKREREMALAELRDLVATLATGAAGRIVQTQMDPAAQRALVDDFIESAGRPQ